MCILDDISMEKDKISVRKSEKFNMSASVQRRATRKYRSRILLEKKRTKRPRTGILITGVEQAILFRAKLTLRPRWTMVSSTAAVRKPNDKASEDDTRTSVEDVTKLMDINISRIDTMQYHRPAVDESYKKVRSQLRTYRTNNTSNTMIDCAW